MKLNQKMLLIALSVLSYSAIMSMKVGFPTLEEEEAIRERVDNKADLIALALKAEYNPEDMLRLGNWLTTQRKDFPETSRWNFFYCHLTRHLDECCWESYNTIEASTIEALRDVIARIVEEDIKSGQDCSQLLVDRAQEAIREVQQQKITNQ